MSKTAALLLATATLIAFAGFVAITVSSPPTQAEPNATPTPGPPMPLFPGPFDAVAEAGELVIGSLDPIALTGCPGGEGEDCITFEGASLDEDGNYVVPKDNVDFPVIEVRDSPDVPIDLDIIITARNDVEGTIEPGTGDGTMNVELLVELDFDFDGSGECALDVDLELITGTSGVRTGHRLFDDGTISFVDGLFPLGAFQDTGGGFICAILSSSVGLPSPSGQNEAQLDLLISQDAQACEPPPPWPVPEGDSDCDGFSDERELFIGTDPFAACGPNAWPPDFNDDGVANVLDFIILSARFGTQSGDPGYSQRFDLNTDGFINVLDFIILSGFFGHECYAP